MVRSEGSLMDSARGWTYGFTSSDGSCSTDSCKCKDSDGPRNRLGFFGQTGRLRLQLLYKIIDGGKVLRGHKFIITEKLGAC